MHLGRFHRAIEILAKEFRETNHGELIQLLIKSLNAVSANPTNAEISTAFKTNLENCRTTLASSSLNHTRPILSSIIESIDAREYIGTALFERIIQAISKNQAVPALAVRDLSQLHEDVVLFYTHILSIDDSFTELNVEYDDLNEGESEIGLLVPRNETASTLKDLSKEFSDWHKTLSQIAQLFDKDAAPLQIKTCSTTDWMIYIAATPPILYGVSLCIKGVNTILGDLISTRTLIEQLIAKNVPKEHTEPLLKDIDASFDKRIRELAEKLVDEHANGVEKEVCNEMKNGINISLKTLAIKMNAGAKVELRLVPPPKQNDEEQSELNAETSGDTTDELLEIEKLNQLSRTFDDEIDLLIFDGKSNVIEGLLSAPSEEVGDGAAKTPK